MLKIAMLGTGYVGLVSGSCFAALGFEVICVDKDLEKIAALKAVKIPIYESGLPELVQKNLETQRLSFTTNLVEAISTAHCLFIAVGTPTDPKTGEADLSFVVALAEELAPFLQEHKYIVVKSTVPVGTSRRIEAIIRSKNPKANFDIISNPEFLREGSAVQDFMEPDRIIVGSRTKAAQEIMDKLYQPLIQKGVPIVHTDNETSEMIKYAANCFLATKIAYVNELASLCEKLGSNIEEVVRGVGLDKRIGSGYLKPGPGFGGSCFPKDTLALAYAAREAEAPFSIVEAVIRSNEHRKQEMVLKIIEACGGRIKNKTLGILGVAFKANTDDIRDSAALTIIPGLQKAGAKIKAYDPIASSRACQVLNEVVWVKSPYEAAHKAEALIIVTEWEEFKELDLQRLSVELTTPLLIDLRNLYEPKTVAAAGLRYSSIGRGIAIPEALTASAEIL